MAKAKFPGRPSKIHGRKRVLSSDLINCKDFDGFRAAEDAYCRLSVFDFLFPEENEGSMFHGFSPHDIEDSKKKFAGYVKERDSAMSTVCLKVERGITETKKLTKSKRSMDCGPKDVVKKSNPGTSTSLPPEPKESKKSGGGKPSVSGTPATSGKFVLPSRSAHSSRVIKPNKRFLENLSPDRSRKRARAEDGDDVEKENSVTSALSEAAVCGASSSNTRSPSKDKTSSPVKFVLQKPKLQITSEPYSLVEGPFSSQTSPPSERLKDPKRPPTKVICGVCGSMWYYKHVKQARKYGIFSCDPCNKFIMRTLKGHENKSIGVYACSSSTGNCVIRQSTLGSCIPFSVEKQPDRSNSSSRCQACWLNLCLHSYHLPPELVKRLSKYLPPEIQDRPIVESESKKPGLRSSSDASNPKEEPKEGTLAPMKTSKGKIKLPLTGPRIKHVCRSASLVLGQPVTATFDDKGSADLIDGGIALDVVESSDSPPSIPPETSHGPTSDSTHSDRQKNQRPVARTLQDLGRDNCELLDGMEKHEIEKKFAKVAIDFWEAYDPEEVTLSGFPLIGFNNLNVRALCFLCGSAGFEKLVHCSNCCEAYHPFCVSSLKNNTDQKEWWRLDWFCPKCTECRACSKPGGTQLLCASCHSSYHSNCVSSGRANVIDGTWMCSSCLNCSSCHDPIVHVFVGNVPLCKQCFKLRKKGNFCPLCQVCYDDNDFDTKMMECADCKKWIHAKCEKITDEIYQILSYLPSSIEFVCRNCCKDPPPIWTRAVTAQLKVGLLNVIKALSKNKVVCNMLKSSPMKKSCSCRNYLQKPIILKNLSGPTDTPVKAESEPGEDKCSDLGLLTPNLTKDDEECMESAKINLVNSKVIREENPAVYEFREDADDLPVTRFEQTNSLNLLSIVGWANDRGVRKSLKSPVSVDSETDRKCSCETEAPSPPSIMEIKKKIQSNHYSTLKDFNKDMLEALDGIHQDSTVVYKTSLKQIFPWFDSENPGETSITEDNLEDSTGLGANPSSASDKPSTKSENVPKSTEIECTWKELLTHDPDHYYINSTRSVDMRMCMFCKSLGEGHPSREGRLLYCGYNEWVHLNCALWSSEVFEEIDGSLQNVHSAISRARMIRCFSCGKKGASVGCCARSCPSAYHLACALESNCVFLANKEVYCKTHSHMRGNRDLHDPKDFYVSRSIYVELDPKKRKEVLFSEVRMAIGSLLIHLIGEIIPEDSDFTDVIVPCNYECSRWFWSTVEPWKLVRYFIATITAAPCNDYCPENDNNFTIDHSLEITPPPSPVDNLSRSLNDERDIRNLLSQMVEIVCTREEDSNLVDQQATDLLPPDIEEAIFEDLPHDILDGISMHDIFTKMNFDDFTECKIDKLDMDIDLPSFPKKMGKDEKNCESYKVKSNAPKSRRYDCPKELERWKSNILQLDGAADIDSSDNESMDFVVHGAETLVGEDQPVKCDRCHRTYRSSIGYERHLPSCDTDSSCDSESSEDEAIQYAMKLDLGERRMESMQVVQAVEIVNLQEGSVEEVFLEEEDYEEQEDIDDDEGSDAESCDIQTQKVEMVVDVYQDCQASENGITVEEVQDLHCPDVQSVTSSPAIIVQQIPQESMMPQYVTSYPQPAIQPPPELQYFNSPAPGNFHYQPTPMAQTVLPSVQPTVLGTIMQSDQIVFNQPNPLDIYSPPSNGIYITNPPMLVGMETVVSNTVMSSSQFIPGVPGMMASSYSATTTQVFQTAKPQIEMPQNYVVVNTQPVQPVVNHQPNLGLMPNNMQHNPPWNNYQMNIQEYKVGNVGSSIQTVTRKVIHEHKEVDGVKTINSTHETIVIEPVTHNNNLQQHYSCMTPVSDTVMSEPIFEKALLPVVKPPQPKVVELPRMPIFKREKPQQAVAPVVIKKIPPPIVEKKELAPKVVEKKENPKCNDVYKKFNGACDRKCSDVYDAPKFNGVNAPKHYGAVKKLKQNCIGDSNGAGSSPKYNGVDALEVVDNFPNAVDVPVKNCESSGDICDEISVESSKECEETEMASQPDDVSIVNEVALVQNGVKEKVNKSKKQPKITYHIRSEDGLVCATSDLESAWQTIFEKVQEARKIKGLPTLSKNPFVGTNTMLKKALGLGNNGVKFILEQLPGVSSCSNYKPVYHKKELTALELELSKKPKENYSGCARTEEFSQDRHPYDMFSWLASRHRRPPKLTNCDNDILNGNGRRATSMNLPMAMRFRHLKETSKITVGVFRSDIHGRGLFALREIDPQEMVIEYAGEVIRSSLTDKREKYYTAKGIGCYMFRIDDNTVVDATMKGNAARFINHSCEPNCYSKVVDILGKKHILIFALKKIVQGDELTYDYKFPLEEDKINCHCLSRKCRKYLN